MRRTYIIYGIGVAGIALILDLMAYRFLIRKLPTDLYVAAVASVFVAIGIWAGVMLTPRRQPSEFAFNEQAANSLGLTRRECEALQLLALGQSNKEIARNMGVSPNTVKTHISNLYSKLDVTSRARAVTAARELSLVK